MALFDSDIYWRQKTDSPTLNFATHYERLKTYVANTKLMRIIATNNDEKSTGGMSISDFLKIKKEDAYSPNIARTIGGTPEEQAEALNAMGVLTEEETVTYQKIAAQSSLEALKLYFNAYMAPTQSDIEWRLGKVTGVYMPEDANMQGLVNENGEIYTRSNFKSPLKIKFWNGEQGEGVSTQGQYFASLFFPPYKIGQSNKLSDKTTLMSDDPNPDATFNQDSFMLKRLGFTYRDPGFKSVNDNIMFLQWAAERAIGVVSTYLTEWDLSIYMQEAMLCMEANGGPIRLWLNYRVRNDNPLATEKEGYTGNKALAFSALNSCVSKFEFDNCQYWRPSDFPLACYWAPYTINKDYKIKWAQLHDDDLGTSEKIPYCSIYDESLNYSYERKPLLDIIRHQDYIGIAMSDWKNLDMQYYQILYSTETDSLTEFDLKLKKFIDKTAGADPGVCTKAKLDANQFKKEVWADMLASGGYVGSDAPAGMGGAGGKYSTKSMKAEFLKWLMFGGDNGASDGSDEANQLTQAKNGAGGMAASMFGPAPTFKQREKEEKLSKEELRKADIEAVREAQRKQASTMGKYTGINRISPPLLGGPHGASYSPLTIQGYFDVENIFLRNTPRIDPGTARNFTSDFKSDLYPGNNKFYYNGTGNSCSPSKSLVTLKSGFYTWIPAHARIKVPTTTMVRGVIRYNNRGFRGCTVYDFPAQVDGFTVQYQGDYVFQSKTTWEPLSNTGQASPLQSDLLAAIAAGLWWNNYYSYLNDFVIRKLQKQGDSWGYLTTVYEIYRKGTYFKWITKTYKKYLLHDEPDTPWQITTHTFLKYKVPSQWLSPYWRILRGLFTKFNIRHKYIMYISQKVCYRLSFKGDAIAEDRVMKNMILAGRGYEAVTPIVFLEGNERGRYRTGPESIFAATCRIERFSTETVVPVKTIRWPLIEQDQGDGTSIKVHTGFPFVRYEWKKQYKLTPYIVVDLKEYDLLYWQDKVNRTPYSNMYKGSSEHPLQFESVPNEGELVQPVDDIVLKFKGTYNDLLQSGWGEDVIKTVTRTIGRDGSGNPEYPMPEHLYPVPRKYEGQFRVPNTNLIYSYNTNKDQYLYNLSKDQDQLIDVSDEVIEKIKTEGAYDPEYINLEAYESVISINNPDMRLLAYYNIDYDFQYYLVDEYGNRINEIEVPNPDSDTPPTVKKYLDIYNKEVRLETLSTYYLVRWKPITNPSSAITGLYLEPSAWDYADYQRAIIYGSLSRTEEAANSEDPASGERKFTDFHELIDADINIQKMYFKDWYREIVYERQENMDVAIYEADTLHLVSEPGVNEGDIRKVDPSTAQRYVETAGKIIKSVKFYADEPATFQYYAHSKSNVDVLREADVRKQPNYETYRLSPDLYTGEVELAGHIEWRSVGGSAGISGIGLLSCIPGINPQLEEIPYENFKQYMQMPLETIKNTPIESLPFKTHTLTDIHAKTGITEDGSDYILPGGVAEYRSNDMDAGLKHALAIAGTRCTFFKIEKPAIPYLISLDVPFRVLLNVCLMQHSFLSICKELLLDNVDFGIMYNILDECIDKCVAKANGFYTTDDPEGPRADPNHILYNYWIECAVKYFGDKTKHAKTRALVEEGFTNKMAKLEYAISVLEKPCYKYAYQWSWGQIMQMYEVLQILNIESKQTTDVEKYIMGYLNMLYQYRMFFICRRFNKENGTMWIMRQLESILDFVAPYGTNDNPPPSPALLQKNEPSYKVAFVELQNTSSMKKQYFINNWTLPPDRVKTCYVKVKWVTKSEYEAYRKYVKDPLTNPEVPEIVKIIHNKKRKYAEKPIDGVYSLISKEILDNDKDIKWNNCHPNEEQRYIQDYDIATWYITWGNEKDKTPIRWNVFVNLDPEKLIEYVDSSLSPEELICLAEEGADFWTVHVPVNMYPLLAGLKTKVKLKHFDPTPEKSLQGDAYVALEGSQAYSLFPVLENQIAPDPSVAGGNYKNKEEALLSIVQY